MKPLGTKKNHATYLDKKNNRTSWDNKNHATFQDKKNHAIIGNAMKLKFYISAEFSFFYFQHLKQGNNQTFFKLTGPNGVLGHYIFYNKFSF